MDIHSQSQRKSFQLEYIDFSSGIDKSCLTLIKSILDKNLQTF